MTFKEFTKTKKFLDCLMILSGLIMVSGFLFLVNAMGFASFYKSYSAIENTLAKYIIVIINMAAGMMLFSNVCLRYEDEKLRKGLTIFITVFMFVLTLPLTYVLISLLPFAANHDFASVDAAIASAKAANDSVAMASEQSAIALGLNPIDQIMGVHGIYWGFCDWFGTGAFLWVVLVVMAIVGVVFLVEPVAAGVCVCKGKLLQLFGKDDNGKFKPIAIVELPVLKKQRLLKEAQTVAKETDVEETAAKVDAEAAADVAEDEAK